MVLKLPDETFVFFRDSNELKLLISKNTQNTVNGSTQIVLTMSGLKELQESAANGTLRFELRTASAQLEGNVNMESYEKKLYA